jgi:hypothetical protein
MKGGDMFWTMFRKDVVQHFRPLLGLLVSAMVLPLAFALISESRARSAGFAGFIFGFLGVSAPIMMAQWFIGQEKVKGTLRVLRLLPLSLGRIVWMKCLGALAICSLIINTALVLEPVILRYGGIGIAQPPLLLVVWTNATAALILGISMALFSSLDTRIALQAAIWTLCGFMILGYAAQKLANRKSWLASDQQFTSMAGHPGWILGTAVFMLVAAFLMMGFSAWQMDRKDWEELEEN